MPSGTLAASAAVRLALVLAGIPVSLLAIVGFVVAWRRDPTLRAPARPPGSVCPLAPYYFIAKVPTSAFFSELAFAAIALEALADHFGQPGGHGMKEYGPPGEILNL